MFTALRVATACIALLSLYHIVFRPLSHMRFYKRQGLNGTPFTPLIGDMPFILAKRRSGAPFLEWFREWDQKYAGRGVGPTPRQQQLQSADQPAGRATPAGSGSATASSKGAYWMWFGPEFRLRVLDPGLIQKILVSHNDCFVKPPLMKRTMGRLLGEGLLLSEGAVHRRHRQMVAPAFRHQQLKAMDGIMVKAACKAVGHWTAGNAAAPFDMHESLSSLTLDIISQAAFGAHTDTDADIDTAANVAASPGGTATPHISSSTPATGGGSATIVPSHEIYSSLGFLLTAMTASVQGLVAFIPGFSHVPTATNRRIRDEVHRIRDMLSGIVVDRRRVRERQAATTSKSGADVSGGAINNNNTILLDHLIDARDESEAAASSSSQQQYKQPSETGVPHSIKPPSSSSSSAATTSFGLTDKEVLDEAITFIMAGHETTSQALTWTLYLLCEHPEWKRKAQEQVDSVLGQPDGGRMQGQASRDDSGPNSTRGHDDDDDNARPRQPTYDDLASMPLLTSILQESMRLYPPAPIVVRTATCDVDLDAGIDGSTLKVCAGTTLVIPIAALHRDPVLWPEPDSFKPDRWADGLTAALKHPCAYIPFSLGPRNCVGQQFALQEAKLLLAVILSRVDFSLTPDYIHQPSMAVTLRPAHGMPMQVWPRR